MHVTWKVLFKNLSFALQNCEGYGVVILISFILHVTIRFQVSTNRVLSSES